MNAPTRRRRARRTQTIQDRRTTIERWQRAIEIRQEWLGYGLSTEPADRDRAESAITRLYTLVGRDRPRFVWVDSPTALADAVPESTPLDPRGLSTSDTAWSVTSALADLRHRLRSELDGRTIDRPRWQTVNWARTSPPEQALERGVPLSMMIQVGVFDALGRTLADGLSRPQAKALGNRAGPVWHGQHDAHWLARYDVLRRLGMGRHSAEQVAQLALWSDIARSCGWWWPGPRECVIAERMSTVDLEPIPGAVHGELRPHNGEGPAVRYRDGTGFHAWHGTRVPEWVVTGPTAALILAEPNAEVRRCAIERVGWGAYLAEAGLERIAEAPDPGNPGCRLELYDVPHSLPGGGVRVLLAVNGSVERDGTRRRYGLRVPLELDDPVAAAGWSYGLTGEAYATLRRRT